VYTAALPLPDVLRALSTPLRPSGIDGAAVYAAARPVPCAAATGGGGE
jgi:hypothetical protein